jgi:PAS domain S-box-containing protein
MVERPRRRNRPPGRERELRAMFELSGAGMALAEALIGRFTDVNGTFCEITGYGADELLGLTFRDITHPDDRQRDVESFERVLRGETDRWSIEKRCLRKDGGIRWVLVSGRLLRDEKGHPARTVAIIQDITERGGRDARETAGGSRRRWRASPMGSSRSIGSGATPTSARRAPGCCVARSRNCSARWPGRCSPRRSR